MIGTHALLEEQVQFADLGLVVIDEQHRFGVEQRDALRDKAGDGRPHVLVMTATPIPRTVAMTVFGDLEVSELTELPAGRSPIATHVVPAAEKPHYLDRTWERVTRGGGARAGRPTSSARGSAATARRSRRRPRGRGPRAGGRTRTPARRTGGSTRPARRPPRSLDLAAAARRTGRWPTCGSAVLHGRLPPDEKDKVMLAFADGQIDVLVTTTVVEVGVDVPNATAMVIMDADRFGVSQLHQLRGRVGRGGHAGLCLLVTEAPDGRRPGSGWTRWPRPWTASRCPGSTSSSAGRAMCSAPPRPAASPA